MDSDLYDLTAYHSEHGIHPVKLAVREAGDDYIITCQLPMSDDALTGQADDCFAALQTIRRAAEDRNWKICCQGARRDVRPSAMSRQMGGGIMAYVLEMGQPGRMDSTVEIFDAAAPESYSTVADQEAYAQAWFESLR